MMRKRQRPDNSTGSPLPFLSAAEVTALTNNVAIHRDTLLSWFDNEKLTERKECLRAPINGFCDAFNSVSTAYLSQISAENTVESVIASLDIVCKNVEQAAVAVTDFIRAAQNNAIIPERSYANVASNLHSSTSKVRNNIVLSKSKNLPIDIESRVIVGPKVSELLKFANSDETKKNF